VSEETARRALTDALTRLLDNDEVVEVSAAEHELSTVALFDLAGQVREERDANVAVRWQDDGALVYDWYDG